MRGLRTRRGRPAVPAGAPGRSRFSLVSIVVGDRRRAVAASRCSRSGSSASASGARRRGIPSPASFGALPFIWGTLYSSILALRIATPIALGIAIFLSEMCPAWLRDTAGVPDRTAGGDPLDRLRPLGHLRPGARWCASSRPSLPDWVRAMPMFSGPAGRREHARGGADPGDHDRAVHVVGRPRGAQGGARRRSARAPTLLARPDGRPRRSRSTTRAPASSAPSCSASAARSGETMAVTMVIGNTPEGALVAVRAAVHDGGRHRQRVHARPSRNCTSTPSSRSASCSSSSRSSSTARRGC